MNPIVESKTSPTKQTKVFVVAGTYSPKTQQRKKVFGFADGKSISENPLLRMKYLGKIFVAVTLHRKKGLLTVGFP